MSQNFKNGSFRQSGDGVPTISDWNTIKGVEPLSPIPVLLIHSDTTDGSVTFVDSSPSAHSFTNYGAEHSTTEKKFGTSALGFVGTDRLVCDNGGDFDFGTGDFTIDYWMYKSDYASNDYHFDIGSGAHFLRNLGTAMDLYASGAKVLTTGLPTINVFTHIALTRKSGTFYLFYNGVLQNSTYSTNAFGSTASLTIGNYGGGGGYGIDGYIDEFRVIKGTAVWTANFTPPTSIYSSLTFYNYWNTFVPIIIGGRVLALIEEPYGDVAIRIYSLIEELWGISSLVNKTTEELYNLTPLVVNVFEEKYGLKMGISYVQYYGDVNVPLLTINEYYDDTYIPKVRIVIPYNNARRTKQTISEIWNMPASPVLVVIQPYAVITGNKAIVSIEQEYDIRSLNKIIKSYDQPYYMISDSSVVDSVTVGVSVNGVSIDIIGINIDAGMDKYAILGSLTLASETDYINCPLLGDVECILNGYSFNFFIETRSRQVTNEGGTSYSISLVSPTAKLDSPYSKTMVLSFTTGMYASGIVQQMADYVGITVDWQIIDWAIPSYAISANDETPLTVIKKIVNSVGAIVQTKPNGDMLIISQYPISPKDFETSIPVTVLSAETDIISIDDAMEINDGINAFVVTDQGTSSAEITLEEVEVTSTSKIIRGFRVPFDDGEFDLETSGGIAISINKTVEAITATIPEDFDDNEEWEYVEFIDGAGTTAYPIYEIVDWEWASEDLGAFQLSESGTLTIVTPSDNSESLLKIKYKTKYWEWIVTGPESRHAQLYVPELETT